MKEKYKNQFVVELELESLKRSPVEVTPRLKHYATGKALKNKDADDYKHKAFSLLHEIEDEELARKLTIVLSDAFTKVEKAGYSNAKFHAEYDKNLYSNN